MVLNCGQELGEGGLALMQEIGDAWVGRARAGRGQTVGIAIGNEPAALAETEQRLQAEAERARLQGRKIMPSRATSEPGRAKATSAATRSMKASS